jgi:hypothetical protein
MVDGGSPYLGLRARGILPRRHLGASISANVGQCMHPSLVIGLEPQGTCRYPFSIAIPQRLKPSPLRFVYYDLAAPTRRIDPDRVLFSFLDFDVL